MELTFFNSWVGISLPVSVIKGIGCNNAEEVLEKIIRKYRGKKIFIWELRDILEDILKKYGNENERVQHRVIEDYYVDIFFCYLFKHESIPRHMTLLWKDNKGYVHNSPPPGPA